MNTLIGHRLREFSEGRVLMTMLCAIVVLLDLAIGYQWRYVEQTYDRQVTAYEKTLSAYRKRVVQYEKVGQAYQKVTLARKGYLAEWAVADMQRVLLAFVLLGFCPILVNGRMAALGLSISPTGGWRKWGVTGLALLFGVMILAIPVGAIWWLARGEINFINVEDWTSQGVFVATVILVPFTEEVIYRLGVCTPVVDWLGPRSAILASGSLFCIVHLVHGGLNPVNIVAGFVLAWTFLKSNSIVIPLLFHSVGNFLAWYVITEWSIRI